MPAKRFNPRVGDLVYFRWEDHCSYEGSAWRRVKHIGAMLTGSICETTGFVIDITRDHITTVAHITVNEEGGEGEDGSHVATRLRRAIISGKVIQRFK
jgi:hypothetical protein